MGKEDGEGIHNPVQYVPSEWNDHRLVQVCMQAYCIRKIAIRNRYIEDQF
jgi:hypothetical protein